MRGNKVIPPKSMNASVFSSKSRCVRRMPNSGHGTIAAIDPMQSATRRGVVLILLGAGDRSGMTDPGCVGGATGGLVG
jgi:hypothetical protein